jgi:hypothetical protein
MATNSFEKTGKSILNSVKNVSTPRTTATSALEGRLKVGVAARKKAKKKKILKAAVIKKVKF